MAAREFLRIVKESSYGVAMAAPVAGTDSLVIRLDGGNGFSMRPKPRMYEVMYGGGRATPALTGSEEMELKGSLQTKLYASQAKMLLDWCSTVINTGGSLPWTTTEPAGDLASCSIFHAITRSDGSVKRRLYPGVKVDKWKLDGSRDSQLFALSLDLWAQKVTGNTYDATTDPDATAFPAPAETDYPTDPYLFSHTSGGLKIGNGGTARAAYESISIDVDNVLDGRAFESRFLQYCRFLGRTSKLNAKLLYKPSPDDRASYEAITTQVTSLKLDNITHQATIDFKGQNFFKGCDDDLPLEKLYEQGLQLQNYWDPTAATDIAFTFV